MSEHCPECGAFLKRLETTGLDKYHCAVCERYYLETKL